MRSRIENLHKALSEARVREHPSDVDLRYSIIGFGIATLIVGILNLDILARIGNRTEVELNELVVGMAILFVVTLYAVSKLCRAFPVVARWGIFYTCFAFSIAYLALIVFYYPALLVLGIVICAYSAIVSYISVRQIYKYHVCAESPEKNLDSDRLK